MNCKEAITILYLSQEINIRLKNGEHHSSPNPTVSLIGEARSRITSLSEGGMSPFQLMGVLRAEIKDTFIYNHFYNTCADAIISKFRLYADPVQSVKVYLESSENMLFMSSSSHLD